MKTEGNGGNAVTRVNDVPFQGFTTRSGRTLEDDLARARKPFVSPIRLAPQSPGSSPTPSASSAPRQHRRKPATPARLPAPRAAKPATTPDGHRAPVTRPRPGGGQSPNHEAMFLAYCEGHSISHVAEMFGTSWTTVSNALNERHVVRRDHRPEQEANRQATERRRPNQPVTPALARKIRADVLIAYEAGNRTISGISRALGVSWPTVKNHLAALNLTPDDGRATMSRKRRPDLSIADMKERYAAGESCAEIAASLATTPKTVRGSLRRAGVELRDDRTTHSGSHPKTYDPALVRSVLTLYEQGFSQTEVGVYCGVSQHVVLGVMRANGIQARPAVARKPQDHAATHAGHVRSLGGAAAIREWAAHAGIGCPDRGLPPVDVLEAYIDAHPPTPHPDGTTT